MCGVVCGIDLRREDACTFRLLIIPASNNHPDRDTTQLGKSQMSWAVLLIRANYWLCYHSSNHNLKGKLCERIQGAYVQHCRATSIEKGELLISSQS